MESSTMLQQPFEVEINLPVRTYDIDFAGIVSNIVYIRWLEDMRLEMLHRYFPLDEQLKNGFAPMIMQTQIDYKQAIRMADNPRGKMWLQSLESLRFSVSAEITVNGKIAALGQQVCVFVNLLSNKPIRIPEQLKQQYRQFVSL